MELGAVNVFMLNGGGENSSVIGGSGKTVAYPYTVIGMNEIDKIAVVKILEKLAWLLDFKSIPADLRNL